VQRATPSLITRDGSIAINTDGETNLPGVYAGGDVTNGGSTVTEAMRDGHAAAEAIHHALRGKPGTIGHVPTVQSQERFRIVANRQLAPGIFLIEVEAPEVAGHWRAGQFVVLRPTADSERIPLTVVDGDPSRGTVTLVFHVVGKTTRVLASLQPGAILADLLGPLGNAATADHFGEAWCVGGGVGIAELLPVVRALRRAGNHVAALVGVRSINLQILGRELLEAADEVYWATDDGSAGFHGTVVDLMRDIYNRGRRVPAFVHVIGPVSLMRAAAELTCGWNVRTVASLNPIMVDGTGMCGGCRASVGGKPVFVCVDGPEFDAHQVDFDELALRNRAYLQEEKLANECAIACRRSSSSTE
jgi:ferredoxin--NADP+ reductase